MGVCIFMKLIPLSKKGKHKNKYFAQVDDEDYEYLNQFNWQIALSMNRPCASRFAKEARIFMHNEIMKKVDSSLFVDHIDHDGLNNQRSNLRIGTHSQNCQNRRPCKNTSSKYRGVYWHKKNKKWASAIRLNKKLIFLGMFINEEDAARAYDNKAKEIHGEWTYVNFK